MTPRIIAIGIKASETFRGYITSRLDAVLKHAEHHVQKITIRLSDLSGSPKGGNKRCLIEIILPDCAPIIVSGIADDITSAIEMATGRVSKIIDRVISKTKSIPHVTMPLYIKKSFMGT